LIRFGPSTEGTGRPLRPLHDGRAAPPDLGAEESARALDQRLRHYCTRTALLVIDESGYLSYDNRNADLLFQSTEAAGYDELIPLAVPLVTPQNPILRFVISRSLVQVWVSALETTREAERPERL